MEKLNLYTVFYHYAIGMYDYTQEQAIKDARLIVKHFMPSKNVHRAAYQWAKLCGVINSVDLMLIAALHLNIPGSYSSEWVGELIKLKSALCRKLCALRATSLCDVRSPYYLTLECLYIKKDAQ